MLPRIFPTRREAAQVLLASIVISAILFGAQYLLKPFDPPSPPVKHVQVETIVVKETDSISFQREGDWVLATFVDGEVCVHDKRRADPVCGRAIPVPTIKSDDGSDDGFDFPWYLTTE